MYSITATLCPHCKHEQILTSSPVKEVKEVKEVKVAKPHKRKKFHNLAVHVQDFSFLLGVYIVT
jgi:hypothetical protein